MSEERATLTAMFVNAYEWACAKLGAAAALLDRSVQAARRMYREACA